MKATKKLATTMAGLMLSVILATSTTFAWFTMNSNAIIDQVELDVTSSEYDLFIGLGNVNTVAAKDYKVRIESADFQSKLSGVILSDVMPNTNLTDIVNKDGSVATNKYAKVEISFKSAAEYYVYLDTDGTNNRGNISEVKTVSNKPNPVLMWERLSEYNSVYREANTIYTAVNAATTFERAKIIAHEKAMNYYTEVQKAVSEAVYLVRAASYDATKLDGAKQAALAAVPAESGAAKDAATSVYEAINAATTYAAATVAGQAALDLISSDPADVKAAAQAVMTAFATNDLTKARTDVNTYAALLTGEMNVAATAIKNAINATSVDTYAKAVTAAETKAVDYFDVYFGGNDVAAAVKSVEDEVFAATSLADAKAKALAMANEYNDKDGGTKSIDGAKAVIDAVNKTVIDEAYETAKMTFAKANAKTVIDAMTAGADKTAAQAALDAGNGKTTYAYAIAAINKYVGALTGTAQTAAQSVATAYTDDFVNMSRAKAKAQAVIDAMTAGDEKDAAQAALNAGNGKATYALAKTAINEYANALSEGAEKVAALAASNAYESSMTEEEYKLDMATTAARTAANAAVGAKRVAAKAVAIAFSAETTYDEALEKALEKAGEYYQNYAQLCAKYPTASSNPLETGDPLTTNAANAARIGFQTSAAAAMKIWDPNKNEGFKYNEEAFNMAYQFDRWRLQSNYQNPNAYIAPVEETITKNAADGITADGANAACVALNGLMTKVYEAANLTAAKVAASSANDAIQAGALSDDVKADAARMYALINGAGSADFAAKKASAQTIADTYGNYLVRLVPQIANKTASDGDFYYGGTVTIYIWLDGNDGDCFSNILNDKISVKLGFKGEVFNDNYVRP